MESWRYVWRNGFAKVLSLAGLLALRDALWADDARLTQGSTTTPPPLMSVADWPCEAACGIAFAGWQGEQLETVGEVEEFFGSMCYAADYQLGEPGGVRYFLNWFDDTPRKRMIIELLAEVERSIAEKQAAETPAEVAA